MGIRYLISEIQIRWNCRREPIMVCTYEESTGHYIVTWRKKQKGESRSLMVVEGGPLDDANN